MVRVGKNSDNIENVEKDCFVICPIGDAGSEIRRRSDQVLRHVIEPAVERFGYRVSRADKIAEPGMITSQLLQRVINDHLVVADLTDRNPNVYYELAVRHAIRKPLIQMIQRGEALPFDVAGTRTINFDYKDLDSVDEAKTEIGKQIEYLNNNSSSIESPISVSLDLQNLRQSDNPEERSLGDILLMITDLRAGVAAIDKRLADPASIIPPGYLREFISRASNKESQSSSRELAFMSMRLVQMLESAEGLGDARKDIIDIVRRIRSLSSREI